LIVSIELIFFLLQMLATKEKSSVTHAKDFCGKNAPK
jgi:hypothetical protein